MRNSIRRGLLCTIAALVVASGSCTRALGVGGGETMLRVMTFNIAAGNGNLDSIIATIAAQDAGIVALQEVDVHWHARSGFANQAAILGERLRMQVRFAHIYKLDPSTPGAPPREYGLAVLSKYPIVEFENHPLTRLSTVTAGSPPSPMPGHQRVVVDVNGVQVRVFNTHLDYRPDPAVRVTQVAEMLSIIGRDERPTLLFGDLNAPPEAPELQPLLARLHDTWPSANGTGMTYPATTPVKRIDYVLASSGFRVLSARLVETRVSDHRPVVVDLRLP